MSTRPCIERKVQDCQVQASVRVVVTNNGYSNASDSTHSDNTNNNMNRIMMINNNNIS